MKKPGGGKVGAMLRRDIAKLGKAPPAASKRASGAPGPSKQAVQAKVRAQVGSLLDLKKEEARQCGTDVRPVQLLRPSMEALSEQASTNLAKQRAELVLEINRAYGRVKFAEVKRLAVEAGYLGLVIAEITMKEEQVFMVKDP